MSKPLSKTKRKRIIAEVDAWAEEYDVGVSMWGTTEDRWEYAAAIVGVTAEPKPAVIYDYHKLLDELMRMNGWTYDEAVEWYEFNMVRSLPHMTNPPIISTELPSVHRG